LKARSVKPPWARAITTGGGITATAGFRLVLLVPNPDPA